MRWDFVDLVIPIYVVRSKTMMELFYFNTGTWMQLIRLSAAQLAQPDRFMKLPESLFGIIRRAKSLSDLAAAGLTWNRQPWSASKRRNAVQKGNCWWVKEGKEAAGTSRSVDLVSLQEWPFAVENGEQRT